MWAERAAVRPGYFAADGDPESLGACLRKKSMDGWFI